MSYGLIDYNTLKDISDALRFKAKTNVNYYPRSMAAAINGLITGGGFQEPIMYSTGNYYVNERDNNIIKRPVMIGFETTNVLPVVNTPPDTNNGIYGYNNVIYYVNIIDYDVQWETLSPGNLTFYEVYKSMVQQRYTYNSEQEKYVKENVLVNGYVYGLCSDNKWNADEISVLDISNLAYYAQNLQTPYCGKYTTNLANAYKECQQIFDAVCGPGVIDMSYTYYDCYNIRNGACGNNVIKMPYAYANCSNLLRAEIGPNVVDLSCAFTQCYNLTGFVNIPSTAKKIEGAFSGCRNISSVQGDLSNVVYGNGAFFNCNAAEFGAVNLNKLMYGDNMFNNCHHLTTITNMSYISHGFEMFHNCYNLTDIEIFNASLMTNSRWMFENCYNLNPNVVDKFMETVNIDRIQQGSSMFGFCSKINQVHITNKYFYANGDSPFGAMFRGCSLDNVIIDDDVTSLSSTDSYAGGILAGSFITHAVCPPQITNLIYAYRESYQLTDAVIGAGVNNAYYAYFECTNLKNIVIDPECNAVLDSTFIYCHNLVDAVCGNNIQALQFTYRMCNNLVNAACGENTEKIYYAYDSCPNLTYAACGPNVTNMYYAYYNCRNLIKPNIGNNVEVSAYAYSTCPNISGDIEIFSTNLYHICFMFVTDNNLANIYMASEKINANKTQLNNAFQRTLYSVRRNIVMANYNSWVNFKTPGYYAVGGVGVTEETYDPPIEVNVNNNMYNVVRCAYNTSRNIYIYCME